ncbi:MAG: hypothetical protein OHK0053_24730 [Microscillaceae bacterium]
MAWILMLSLIHFEGLAQVEKFGKISAENLRTKVCPIDSGASAFVVQEVDKSYFQIMAGRFRLIHEYHIRVHILKKEGYEYANVEIPYYVASSGEKEEVSELKGYTYTLNEKNELVKTKLERDAIFDESDKGNWKVKKFTMPNVSEGCVIEYEYKILSDFFENLREWYFQRPIPVLWSQYEVSVPEYFYYKKLSGRYESFYQNKEEQYVENFTVTYSSEITPGLNGGRTSGGTFTLNP